MLKLGNKTFDSNIIQAPLAGVSCGPFRRLAWQHGKLAFSCTEMISCKTLLHSPLAIQQRFVSKDPEEGPVCFQLSGTNPDELGKATALVTKLGADLIDLNCGCPVKKIRTRGAGSRLLTSPEKLHELILAMKNNTDVPVSIKIRVEGGSNDQFNKEIVDVVESAKPDYMTVHGRHWTEHYETPVNYQQIKYFVDNVSIPVIGNGDVADVESYQAMLATGCAGVMIGRAGVGQPWLSALLQNPTHSVPSQEEIFEMYLEHVEGLIALLRSERFAMLQARKFSKYYARVLPDRAAFVARANQAETLADLIAAIKYQKKAA